ncbi:MAG: bifunctional adenosylcobinamide kinase/adenosylcobinamide-phosphate guanylyltransferase [Clostridiales bacterium]|jgi:adenosylcobinamide kinase/adenosylcobinamide-phosphate guanylyltransferase|nr:bifunctional adenosylcobinamide kinase/adenosylcobinamide-phosphate guanylyltransferase [Clostridiales bacterium]
MTLITGGARVGKTKLAINLCKDIGPQVLYLAAGGGSAAALASNNYTNGCDPLTDVFFEREIIRRSRKQRPFSWDVREGFLHIAETMEKEGGNYDAILLENVRSLISNLMYHFGYSAHNFCLRTLTVDIVEEINRIISTAQLINSRVIFVTNEVQLYPTTADHHYKVLMDILGRINQHLASVCDDVYFVASGIPLKIK